MKFFTLALISALALFLTTASAFLFWQDGNTTKKLTKFLNWKKGEIENQTRKAN